MGLVAETSGVNEDPHKKSLRTFTRRATTIAATTIGEDSSGA